MSLKDLFKKITNSSTENVKEKGAKNAPTKTKKEEDSCSNGG